MEKAKSFSSVIKAIAGASAGAIGSIATTFIVVPENVVMPWYGYVAVGILNAALSFGIVYLSPKNKEVPKI